MILKRPTITVERSPQSRSFVAIATYVPIARWRDVPKAARLSGRVEAQIKKAPGAISYSLAVNPLRRQFWTCSVWADRAFAEAFTSAEPHATAVARFAEWAGEGAAFVEWQATSPRLEWSEAFERLETPTRYYAGPSDQP